MLLGGGLRVQGPGVMWPGVMWVLKMGSVILLPYPRS